MSSILIVAADPAMLRLLVAGLGRLNRPVVTCARRQEAGWAAAALAAHPGLRAVCLGLPPANRLPDIQGRCAVLPSDPVALCLASLRDAVATMLAAR